MTGEECKKIRQYAKGEASEEEALSIFNVELKRICLLSSFEERHSTMNTPEMQFMREVDNPCPDLALREKYRSKLVEMSDWKPLCQKV